MAKDIKTTVSFDMRAPSWATPTHELYAAAVEMAAYADKIGFVAAKGHSHDAQRYGFLDKNVPLSTSRVFYYRLKINDLDATFKLTETRSVIFDKVGKSLVADISPNPSNGKARLILSGEIQTDVPTEIIVNDMYGRSVFQQIVEQTPANAAFDLELGTSAAGVYFVTVRNGTQRLVKKIVVQH